MSSKNKSHMLPHLSKQGSPSHAELHERFRQDKRFNPPSPSMWKRIALILLVLFLFWIAFKMKNATEPQIIYADRYSRQHKYRPAASPVITERLKDGRIRLRGANL